MCLTPCLKTRLGVIHIGSVYIIINTNLVIERKTLISVVIFSDLLSLSYIPGSIATILPTVAGGGAAVVGEPAGQGGDNDDIVLQSSYLPVPSTYHRASSWQ